MDGTPSDAQVRVIELSQGFAAFVDACDYDWLVKYPWRAVKSHKCWYAKYTVSGNGGDFDLSMHRLIAKTPRGQVCHHRNRNSLDNRRANLLNMSRYEHEALHRNDTLIIKFDRQS